MMKIGHRVIRRHFDLSQIQKRAPQTAGAIATIMSHSAALFRCNRSPPAARSILS